jgi:hypothetical protein
MRFSLPVAVLVNLFILGSALGSLIDENGNVESGWGLRPFSQPNQSDVLGETIWSTIQNDYSPIKYPSGVGHVPSPGGSTGEGFDLEEMHVRFTGTQMKVLVITSSPLVQTVGGQNYYLGDLFIEADGVQFAVVTQSANQGLAAGSIYRLNGAADVVALQPASQSYAGNNTLVENDYGPPATIRDIAGPWAIDDMIDTSQLIGTAAIDTASFNYGGKEDGTFVIEYAFDPHVLGLDDPAILTTKITWGCGNDVIRVRGTDVPHTPEPTTIGLLIFGSVLTYLGRRRRKT